MIWNKGTIKRRILDQAEGRRAKKSFHCKDGELIVAAAIVTGDTSAQCKEVSIFETANSIMDRASRRLISDFEVNLRQVKVSISGARFKPLLNF